MRAEKPMHRVLWRHSGEQRHEHVRFVRTWHIHPPPQKERPAPSQVARIAGESSDCSAEIQDGMVAAYAMFANGRGRLRGDARQAPRLGVVEH
jgi:hypothetical protein